VGKRRDRIMRLTATLDSGNKPAAQLSVDDESESPFFYDE
jgi:hypothetical protein